MYKTMEQIEKEYDGHWVLMINYSRDRHNSVAGGEVVFHDKSMNTVLCNMKQYEDNGNRTCVRYVGTIPEGVAVLL